MNRYKIEQYVWIPTEIP